MKKVVMIVFAILLAIGLGTTYFTGSGDNSFNSQADTIMEDVNDDIDAQFN